MRRNIGIPVIVLFIAALLSACGGGGGGGGGGSPPPPSVPNAPAWIDVVPGDGKMAIGWMPVGNASDPVTYNLYWSTSPGITTTNSTKITGVTNPHTLSGLANGTLYYFVVTAVNSVGESALSAEGFDTPNPEPGLDPLYSQQWHLKNLVPAQTGQDINAEAAWAITCNPGPPAIPCRGDGVRITVVDDGLEVGHEDLIFNVVPGAGHDYLLLNGSDPTPVDRTNTHGTEVSGVIAARDLNGLGGRGVAPRASIFGYNLIAQGGVDTVSEQHAMTFGTVDVSNNSWGSPDSTGLLNPSNSTWQSAIQQGLTTGRNNKGTIYLWAAGNGGTTDVNNPFGIDNSNYDGQSNYRGVIAVAAVRDDGTRASYSERGANLWVSAPAGDFCNNSRTIITTDLMGPDGKNNVGTNVEYGPGSDLADSNYTQCFNGTSTATPAVSGVVALMLQANPSLTWRDVRYILAETARMNDSSDTGWQGVAYMHHHNYGFGVVDADAAVARAKTWNTYLTGQPLSCTLSSASTIQIPDFGTGPSATNTLTVNPGNCASITNIEFVEATFSSDHTYSGDLKIELTSPSSTKSILAETHICTDGTNLTTPVACSTYSNWVFGSAVHLGENPLGNWTLTVTDGSSADTGNITGWGITIYGH